MNTLTLSLLQRALVRQVAVAVAAIALLTVAALVDGHPPRATQLRALVPLSAAFLGVGWLITIWRHEGGDLALANVGVGPGRVMLVLMLSALPALALATAPTTAPQATLVLDTDRLTSVGPTWTLTVAWDAHGARRDDTMARFPTLPPPTASSPSVDRHPLWRLGARLAVLTLLLVGLSYGPAPSNPVALTATTLAFAAAHGLGHLI